MDDKLREKVRRGWKVQAVRWENGIRFPTELQRVMPDAQILQVLDNHDETWLWEVWKEGWDESALVLQRQTFGYKMAAGTYPAAQQSAEMYWAKKQIYGFFGIPGDGQHHAHGQS